MFKFVAMRSGVSWIDCNGSRHGAMTRFYGVTTPVSPVLWNNDARLGRVGYFLTGHSAESTLWRVFRVEVDALERMIMTLRPVQLAPDLPRVDFSTFTDSDLRLEVIALYEEFCQRVVQHAYRDVPTKDRNIVEGMVAHKLRSQSRTATKRLGEDLNLVKRLLEDSQTRATCGWQDLEYALANKIRLIHGRTHPESATSSLPMRPEFSLSIVEDLNELLRIWGCVA